jgi:hypothetical protein
MNWPYLHTLLNHFPIILIVMAGTAAVVALVSGRRSVWLYALATLTFAGLSIFPAFFTGDKASDVMRDKWYIVPGMIHDHEEAAELALYVVLVAGAVGAYAWWRQVRRDRDTLLPRWLQLIVVVASLAGIGTVAYAAYDGGKIVHESPKLLAAPGSKDAPAADELFLAGSKIEAARSEARLHPHVPGGGRRGPQRVAQRCRHSIGSGSADGGHPDPRAMTG